MMIVSPTPVFRWTDNNGNPAVGWQVETYIAGSSTPVDTYTDATGTAENTNPIILDARGEANIWLDPAISYKYVIKNSLGVVQDTIDQIQAGSGGSGGLTRVYYNDSSSIAYSGLGTLATPLSSAVKLSAYPNNALQIRPDGLYAVAIGGGGSVAWGSITGNIADQTDLINKFGEYLPLTFASAQTLTYTGQGTFVFSAGGGIFATHSGTNTQMGLQSASGLINYSNSTSGGSGNLVFTSVTAPRTWTLPDASGTIALTSTLGDYIKRDGTSTTTASIPFALGATFSDNQALAWSVGSTIRGTGAGNIQVRPWLASNGGFDVLSYVNTFDATTHNILKWNGTTTPPTGTQAYLLGIDANGRIIQGSAGSGFVTISGHNDLTTPWSIGDASTWGTSSAGIQIDPVGSYGLYLKGNAIIEQAVSQALTLYRPVASGDICLNFDAWDSLGAQSNYAQVCGVVVSNTAGSVGGGLDLEVAIAGVLTPLLQLRQAGSTLTGALTASGNLSVETNASDIGFYSRASGSAGTIGGVYVGRGQRGTLASPTATQSGDGLLWLGGQGYGDTGFSAGSRGVIRVRASENWTDLAQGAYISFETTATGGTTRAERGRIENNGVLTWLNRIDTTASTTSSAGLRIPHGTAPSAPVNGDLWSTTTAWLVRTNGATQTIAMLENAQTFSGVKTFSATPVISSTTASTTAGAIYRTANLGLIGYEFGMAQRLQGTIYRAPVGTALTNSVTETDVNGGTAVFGTRTLSNSAMQIGAVVLVFARIKYTNTAANTLTLRLRWSTIAGTILATAVLTRVNAGAEVFDLVFRGIAQVAPSATSATSWSCDVQGQSLIATNATTTSTEATLATSTATPLILSAQWTSALATSSVQVLNSYISVE